MTNEKEEEHEIDLDPNEQYYYYLQCPHCGLKFLINYLCKPHKILGTQSFTLASKKDILQFYCPFCKESIPLVIDKAPLLNAWIWDEEDKTVFTVEE